MAIRDRPNLRDPAYSVPDSDVLALRVACRNRGENLDHLVDWPLRKVIQVMRGDIDLAATAVTMRPRPGWLAHIIGRP